MNSGIYCFSGARFQGVFNDRTNSCAHDEALAIREATDGGVEKVPVGRP